MKNKIHNFTQRLLKTLFAKTHLKNRFQAHLQPRFKDCLDYRIKSAFKKAKNATKNFFAIFALMSLAFFAQGCKDDEIIMATAAEFRPFEYVDGENIKGIDIEIAQEIAKRLNKKLTIKNMKFDTLLDEVASGQADIAISGLSITAEREKLVDFSATYYDASQVVIVKRGDSRFVNIASKKELLDKINSIKDLRIAVQVSTTGHYYVAGNKELGYKGIPNAKIKAFSNGTLAIKSVVFDQADIMVIDEMPATMLTKANPNMTFLRFRLTQEQYGIAINKSKTKLQKSIQKVLEEMKNDGTIAKIISKYT